tara:strand:+ start:455 stop:880 length:426 start_codon:yes stop_codon:yes gene_type:complete
MDLCFENVYLHCQKVVDGIPHLGYVPYYHFLISNDAGTPLGHINFRVGDTEHVTNVAGHIGYGIHAEHRGQGYAAKACLALKPWIKQFYRQVWITSDPKNAASRKTVEKIGAEYVDTIDVPEHETQYQQGSKTKCRYRWVL